MELQLNIDSCSMYTSSIAHVMVFQESNTCLCVCLDYGEQTLYDTGLLEPAVNVVTKLLSP